MNEHVEQERTVRPGVSAAVNQLITENELLWPLTSMHVGGPARWLAEPKTVADLEQIYSWTQHEHLPFLTLGGGTNLLFPDSGYSGVVISIRQLKGIRVNGASVTATAGERLSELAMKMNRAGLSGLEWACGIPGTVGGAVVMNAGAHNGDMAGILESVRVLTPTGVAEWPVEQLELAYRTSALRTGRVEGIILEATLKLHQADPALCVGREQEILKLRQQTQPAGPSCGSIFKNPETGPSAGKLLDEAGCKGMQVGAARVSDQHANFIINDGRNNAADVFTLIAQMKDRVLNQHNISLQQEARTITGDSPRRGLSPSSS